MISEWKKALDEKIEQIKQCGMTHYEARSADDLIPQVSDADFAKTPFPYETYISKTVYDAMHAYAEVEPDGYLSLLHCEFMDERGYVPEDFFPADSGPSCWNGAAILDDGYDLFVWAYLALYEKESSQRRYAIVNGNPHFYYGKDDVSFSFAQPGLPISPEEVITSSGPIVLQDNLLGRPKMIFSVKRTPFVELAKEYGLLGRGKATGYRMSRIAGYDRRNFEAILNPDNPHSITPGQMFAVCLFCRMDAMDAIRFFHECEELNELTDYGIPGTVLALMLSKEEYDYDTFLKVCCETYRHVKEDLPAYLSSNAMWRDAFSRTSPDLDAEDGQNRA